MTGPIDILNASLADLRSGDPDAAKPDVKPGANDDRGPAAKPAGKPPSVEQLLSQHNSVEGRKTIAKQFGILLPDESLPADEVIDVPYRAELDDLHQRIGGEKNFAEWDRKFDLANTLFDLDGELDDRPFASPGEYNEAGVRLVKMVDAILASPPMAQKELDHFYARDPNDPVMKLYIAGDADTVEMVTRLYQAANGEPVVGREKARGDGFVR